MNICIFTVVLNEQDYLDDFLKYHTELGLHIFVFEDLFSCSHKSITDKYDNVELHSVKELYNEEEIPQLIEDRKNKVPPQTSYINRGLRYIHSLNKYDWCALIDIDEFITCTEKFPDILDRYKEHQAVLIYWCNYGCSGHIYKPDDNRPPYEIYTEKCSYEKYSDEKYFKITKFIVNMNKYKPTMKFWIHCANVDFIKADMTYKRTNICLEPLYLRHYITRSWEEFCYKILIRGTFHPGHRQYKSFFEMQPDMEEKIRNDKGFKDYFYKKYGVMPDY